MVIFAVSFGQNLSTWNCGSPLVYWARHGPHQRTRGSWTQLACLKPSAIPTRLSAYDDLRRCWICRYLHVMCVGGNFVSVRCGSRSSGGWAFGFDVLFVPSGGRGALGSLSFYNMTDSGFRPPSRLFLAKEHMRSFPIEFALLRKKPFPHQSMSLYHLLPWKKLFFKKSAVRAAKNCKWKTCISILLTWI